MQKVGETLVLSASDLVGHLNCRHLTSLDKAVAEGRLEKPVIRDPLLDLLRERGARHEQGFVDHLGSEGRAATVIEGSFVDPDAVSETRRAMAAGDDIIVQGAFQSGNWVGRTDILQRISVPSDLGQWSYEVVDTKLARETKGGTVLQLCLYADLVADVQGVRPERGYVVAPWTNYQATPYRMEDYGAYFRRVRGALAAAVSSKSTDEIYPEPREHCEVCRWQRRCEERRRADDHLSLVAGASKVQIRELGEHGIGTVAALASMPLPLSWKPSRGAEPSFARIREQARIQVESREAGRLLHELLPVEPGFGLTCLPEPSPGDVFFDLEGDPFAGEGGLEYLFGYAWRDGAGDVASAADWAFGRDEEKAAFERFVDFVIGRLKVHTGLHVYHYAAYEPAALKRLMGRYATRQDEIDFLLRSKRFVDLYGVVRNGVRAGVESYSIKRLEPLYGFSRFIPLADANRSLTRLQTRLELGDLELAEASDLEIVAGYNRDDCLSTLELRDWLEGCRAAFIGQGNDVPRPDSADGQPGEEIGERQERIAALIARLTRDVPADAVARTSEQQARWLLAHSLDWHRREDKAVWWEYFRLSGLAADDLLDERAALSGLHFISESGGTTRSPVHRYRFPPQETEFRGGEKLRMVGGDKFGSVQEISIEERWVDIKKRGDRIADHPVAVFAHNLIDTGVLADALLRVGEHFAEHGIERGGQFVAARDLLLRVPPRTGGQPIKVTGEAALDAARRMALALEGGVFPIQGPPGAGKTYTGARMICSLVAAGKSVGVTAVSHKVIRNLLDEVIRAADETGTNVECIQRLRASDMEPDKPRLRFTKDNDTLLAAIGNGCSVAGATAWLWASPDAADAVDVLFVDEAAQMSLANVLAASQAARTIVLLGDPQQLEQPMKGSHPEGTDVSALHHLLGGEQTIPPDRGLFLEETWRLHPDICGFTSELFYSGRLRPRAGLEKQRIGSSCRFSGTGLRYVPVATEGNQSSSPEEAGRVREIVAEILAAGSSWVDRNGVERKLTLSDILVIAPYNAQVFELQERLPQGARIGTVDKFQGQEAPIVIYSMTTSSHADAPRGMEFLYSLNRLNVATSRARCLCILVASPSVFEAQCRTPHQMQLANAFCRYLERALVVD